MLIVYRANFPILITSLSYHHAGHTVWIIDTFGLLYLCWKLHALSLCDHCPSLPTLAPSLCTELYTLVTLNSILFLKSSVVSLSFSGLCQCCFHCLESFSHLVAVPTHYSTPLFGQLNLSFRCYLKCSFIQKAFFVIPPQC